MVAYRRTISDEKDYIVVYSLKEDKSISTVDVKNIDPQSHYFISNDYLILTASRHSKGYKHDWDISTAFSLDFKNNKIEPLIKHGETLHRETTLSRDVRVKISSRQTGMGRIVGQDTDGKVVYMPAFVSEQHPKSAFYSAYGRQSDSNYSLLKVDVSGKGLLGVHSQGTPNTRNFFLDDKGNVIARENLNEKTNKHSIEVPEKAKWRTLYSYKSAIVTHKFEGLNEDFTALIFSRSDKDQSHTSNNMYLQLSLADGAVKPFEQMKLNRDTSEVISNDHGVVLGVRYAGLSPDYQLSDAKLHKRVQSILSYFSEHSVHLTDWTDDWKHIVVRVEGTQFAGDYFLFSENQEPKLLTHSRPDINQEDLNPITTTRLKARDGLSIPLILTVPKSKANNIKNLPAIVMPHGGPDSHDQIGFNYMAQALASKVI